MVRHEYVRLTSRYPAWDELFRAPNSKNESKRAGLTLVVEILESGDGPVETVPEAELAGALGSLSKETVWRVKGFVRLERGYCILNWAFGRYDLTPVESVPEHTGEVKLTVMGERGEVTRAARKLATRIGAEVA